MCSLKRSTQPKRQQSVADLMILLRICSSRSIRQLHRVVLRVTVSHYIHMCACSNECLVPILCVCVCACVPWLCRRQRGRYYPGKAEKTNVTLSRELNGTQGWREERKDGQDDV